MVKDRLPRLLWQRLHFECPHHLPDGHCGVTFVTETGLYNVLAQSRKPIARAWRRVIAEELIALRRSRGKNISEQFEDWDHRADAIYFDEETGMLMRSVTVPGGDVEQVPYEP